MPKFLLDTADYKIASAGLWKSFKSLLLRRELSNWIVTETVSNQSFELTFNEQSLLGILLEHLSALEAAPEFAQSGKRAIGKRVDAVVHDALDAIIAARNGDNKKFSKLQSLNHFSFVAHAQKLFDSGIDQG